MEPSTTRASFELELQLISYSVENENCKPSDGIICSVAFQTTFVSHLTKLKINKDKSARSTLAASCVWSF